MSKKKFQIIVAEDNPREREFLTGALSDYIVTHAINGKEALELAQQQQAPWVISDLQMPEMNGIEFARRLWDVRPEARIVFWSHHKDEMYIRSLATIIPPNTVYGYVLKDNTVDILQKALIAVFLDHQCWIDPVLHPVRARANRPHSALTDTEYEVLIDVALGLTDNLIAQRHYLSRRGAQGRLKTLYAKLNVEQICLKQHNKEMEVFNLRVRAVAVAFHRGLINPFELKSEEGKLKQWLEKINDSISPR